MTKVLSAAWVLLVLGILQGIRHSHQQCTEFPEIDPQNYTRTYHTINDGDTGVRPLGYTKAILLYQGSTKPCYSVQGKTEQQVEIKFETVPSMQLCVRDLDSDYERCAEGRFSDCISLGKETARLEFFCQLSRGCAEADVNFWLRVTKGPLPEADTEQMWCHELSEEYPESLRPLPPNFSVKPDPDPYTAGAGVLAAPLLMSLVGLFLGMLLSH